MIQYGRYTVWEDHEYRGNWGVTGPHFAYVTPNFQEALNTAVEKAERDDRAGRP